MSSPITTTDPLAEIRSTFTRLNSRPDSEGTGKLNKSLDQFSEAIVIALMDENGELSDAEMDTMDAFFGKDSPIEESNEDYLEARPDRLKHKVLDEYEDAQTVALKTPLFFNKIIDAELTNPNRLTGTSNEVLHLIAQFAKNILASCGKLNRRADAFLFVEDVLAQLRKSMQTKGINYALEASASEADSPAHDTEQPDTTEIPEAEAEQASDTNPTEDTTEEENEEAAGDGESDSEQEGSNADTEENEEAPAEETDPTPQIREMRTKQQVLEELDGMIGLESVKREVRSLVNVMEVKRLREKFGITAWPRMSLHLVFTGNPGTGKTTIARLIGEAYAAMGVLSNGRFHEVDRSGLIAGYTGQTAIKVHQMCRKAKGGVLFIDEAYSLSHGEDDDYGREAIAALLKFMEDNREDFVVIVSGYEDDMTRFLDSNPGLHSRFNKFIRFDDYSDSQLTSIFGKMCLENRLEASDAVRKAFADALVNERRSLEEAERSFANARTARNIFDKAFFNFCDRIMELPEEERTAAVLTTLQPEDILGEVWSPAPSGETLAREPILVAPPVLEKRPSAEERAPEPRWEPSRAESASVLTPSLVSGASPKLCEADRNRPIENLGFTRPINTLHAYGYDTIGTLLDQLKTGLPKMRNFGSKSERDVDYAVQALRLAVNAEGVVDWQRYTAEFKRLDGTPIQLDTPITPGLIVLHPDDAADSISRLHLSKSIHPLLRADIATLGKLLATPDYQLRTLPAFGDKSLEEVSSAKAAIETSLDENGRIHWDHFAEAEGRILVPETAGAPLLQTLASSCESLLALVPGSPEALVLAKRILPGEGRAADTLENIGREFKQTRERTRQIEHTLLTTLRQAFLFDHYTDLSRRLRSDYAIKLREAQRRLGASGDGAIRTETDWTHLVAESFGVHPENADLVQALPLIRLLLAYETVPFNTAQTLPAIVPATIGTAERDRMKFVVSRLLKFLKSAHAGLSETEIITSWAQKFPGESGVTPAEIQKILPFCQFAERTDNGEIRATFATLSMAGQAFRVLASKGQPMHFEEIRQEIRRRLNDPTAADSLQAALAGSARFVCDGRSGMWRLALK